MVRARRDAALSAYETAFHWFRSYPAHEVERRLGEMIAVKREAAKHDAAQRDAEMNTPRPERGAGTGARQRTRRGSV